MASFWAGVFHELYDLIVDFVDQLLALDLNGLACLLVFCRSCLRLPTTVRHLLVQRIDVLFAVGSCLELNWTESTAPPPCMFFKDSGACFFGCARLSHSGSCCGPSTASPLRHRCTVGVLAGTHRCALMPRWHQGRAPTCLVVVFQTSSTWFHCIAFVRVSCSVSNNNSWFTVIRIWEYLHNGHTTGTQSSKKVLKKRRKGKRRDEMRWRTIRQCPAECSHSHKTKCGFVATPWGCKHRGPGHITRYKWDRCSTTHANSTTGNPGCETWTDTKPDATHVAEYWTRRRENVCLLNRRQHARS